MKIIKNAVVCDINGERRVDVCIENGVISAIGDNLSANEVVDAAGAYLLPLLVDLNVSLDDSQLNAKNIKTTSQKALENGIGHIVLSPLLTPAVDNEVVFEFAQNGVHGIEDGARVSLCINALKDDGMLSNIAILLKRGAVAPYMSTIAKNDIAIKIAQYCQMYGVTLLCKAEDNSLVSSGVMLEGDVSSTLGLAGIPDLSEVLHVSRMIEIARHFKISILFKAVTSPRSIELIDKAKKEGVAVKCEVSIHHLLNSDEACMGFNTTAKLNPPLPSKEDQRQLLEALKLGKIDMLTVLHQPSSPVNKEVAFFDASYGCEGLRGAMSLYYTKFVKQGVCDMSELVRLCVHNPAKVIKESSGVIEVGAKAEFMLFDPNVKVVLNEKLSLYNGDELYGEVRVIL